MALITSLCADSPRFIVGAALLVAIGAIVGTQARAMETARAFPAPDLEDFLMIEEGAGDGDGDGVNETYIVRYRNLAGDKVFSMTTNGRLWAWSREQHGGGTVIERNYVVRDGNCDGIFEERYSLDEQFKVPDCLK
jgi:hypothetical protein